MATHSPSAGYTDKRFNRGLESVFFSARRTVSSPTVSASSHLHQALRQQLDRPLRLALRRFATGEGYQMRFRLAVQEPLSPSRLLIAAQRRFSALPPRNVVAPASPWTPPP